LKALAGITWQTLMMIGINSDADMTRNDPKC
jgi:hypothetical protein